MSSDILEFIEDEKGNDIGIFMNVHGYAFIKMADNDDTKFILSPNEEGINNAKMIISALEAWVEKVGLNNDNT